MAASISWHRSQADAARDQLHARQLIRGQEAELDAQRERSAAERRQRLQTRAQSLSTQVHAHIQSVRALNERVDSIRPQASDAAIRLQTLKTALPATIRSKYGGWIQAKARLRQEEYARRAAALAPPALAPAAAPSLPVSPASWPVSASARAAGQAAHQRAAAQTRAAGGHHSGSMSLKPRGSAGPPSRGEPVSSNPPLSDQHMQTALQSSGGSRTAADDIVAFGSASNSDADNSGSTLERTGSGADHHKGTPPLSHSGSGTGSGTGEGKTVSGLGHDISHSSSAGFAIGNTTPPPASGHRHVVKQTSSRRLGLGMRGLSPGDRQDSGLSSPVSPAAGSVKPFGATAGGINHENDDDEFDDLDEFDLGGGMGAASLGIAPPKKRTDAAGGTGQGVGASSLGFGFMGAPGATLAASARSRPKARATPVSTFAVDDSELDDEF